MKKSLIMLGALAGLAVAGAINVAVRTPAKQTNAAPSTDETHYFYTYSDDITNWNDDGYSAGVWDAENSEWLEVTTLGTNTFSFTWPINTSKVIIARKNGNTWGGQTYDISYDSNYNYYSITSWSNGKAGYNRAKALKFSAGENYYVDVQDASSFWFDDGYSAYLYFSLGSLNHWLSPTRIGTSNLISFTFDEDVLSTFVIVARNTSASWDGKTNQTNNISFTTANASCNAIKLGADDYGTTATKGFETYSSAYVAESFSYYFLSATNGYCSAEISASNIETIASNYAALTTLNSGAAAEFYGATLLHSDDGHTNLTSQALSRYWNMANETSHAKGAVYGDFLGLGNNMPAATNLSVTPLASSSTAEAVTAVSTVAGVGGLAAGLFVLFKKKRLV